MTPVVKNASEDSKNLIASLAQFDKNDKQLSKHLISSPFDYMNQMRVFIPSDTIDPNSIDFIAETEVFIDKLIRKTKGHCFLLFTSYSMLNYLYNKLEKYYNKKD